MAERTYSGWLFQRDNKWIRKWIAVFGSDGLMMSCLPFNYSTWYEFVPQATIYTGKHVVDTQM